MSDNENNRINPSMDDELIELRKKKARGEKIESAFGGDEAKLLPKTRSEKTAYFFYKYKTTIILSVLALVIAVSSIVYAVTKKAPDVSIVLSVSGMMSDEDTVKMDAYLRSVAEDYNGDGAVVCNITYIPLLGEDSSPEAQMSMAQKYAVTRATKKYYAYFLDRDMYDYTIKGAVDSDAVAFADLTGVVANTALNGDAIAIPKEKIIPAGEASVLKDNYYLCIRYHGENEKEEKEIVKQAYMFLESVYKNVNQ